MVLYTAVCDGNTSHLNISTTLTVDVATHVEFDTDILSPIPSVCLPSCKYTAEPPTSAIGLLIAGVSDFAFLFWQAMHESADNANKEQAISSEASKPGWQTRGSKQ
jgi:hypothetical protein